MIHLQRIRINESHDDTMSSLIDRDGHREAVLIQCLAKSAGHSPSSRVSLIRRTMMLSDVMIQESGLPS